MFTLASFPSTFRTFLLPLLVFLTLMVFKQKETQEFSILQVPHQNVSIPVIVVLALKVQVEPDIS